MKSWRISKQPTDKSIRSVESVEASSPPSEPPISGKAKFLSKVLRKLSHRSSPPPAINSVSPPSSLVIPGAKVHELKKELDEDIFANDTINILPDITSPHSPQSPQLPRDGSPVNEALEVVVQKNYAAAEEGDYDDDGEEEVLSPSSKFSSTHLSPASLAGQSLCKDYGRHRREREQSFISLRSLHSQTSNHSQVNASYYDGLRQTDAVKFLADFADATSYCEKSCSENGLLEDESMDDIELVGDTLEAYRLGPVLMAGGFSIVRECVRTDNFVFPQYHPQHDRLILRTVLRKRLKQDFVFTEDEELKEQELHKEMIEHEIKVWSSLSHPNILPLLDTFSSSKAIYTVAPYCIHGNLLDLIKRERDGKMAMETATNVIRSVTRALCYLHEEALIVHGDIKLENVFLDHDEGGNLQVYLADFSMSQSLNLEGQQEDDPEDELSLPGSIPYCSPERLQSLSRRLTKEMDCWSLGVMAFVCLTGRFPFEDAYEPRLMAKILSGEWSWKSEDAKIEPCIKECVGGWLSIEPETRWSTSKALSEKWLLL